MRITRDLLLDHARENAKKLASRNRGLLCIYITGSLLREDPFIGGVTDVDLVCIHSTPPPALREVIRLSPEISLDIAHYEQADFEPPRKLRGDPWIGGGLEMVPVVLHDPLRWYDFTRAAATAQFWRADNVASRTRTLLNNARNNWAALRDETIPQGVKRVNTLLNALEDTANSVVTLSSTPLPMRRLLLELPDRALEAGLYGFAGELVNLFTSAEVNDENFKTWSESFPAVFEEMKSVQTPPPGLNPFRRAYYDKAIRSLYEEHPAASVWILLRTWTKAAVVLPKSGEAYKAWQSLCKQLELDNRSLPRRLEALDALLDQVEDVVDRLQG